MTNPPIKKRIDQWMFDNKMCDSRQKAQDLIKASKVWVNGQLINKPSTTIAVEADVVIKDTELLRFVSRAGLKLEKALQSTSLNVSGLRALDVGQSTGGFTDCLLQNGVAEVVGIDVGRDQLASQLVTDDRVQTFERINAKDFLTQPQLAPFQQQYFDLLVVDVSFISITKILAGLLQSLKPGGHLLALVKPQFELGANALNKSGVVKNPALYDQLEQDMIDFVEQLNLKFISYFNSGFPGKDGNEEFFVFAQKY